MTRPSAEASGPHPYRNRILLIGAAAIALGSLFLLPHASLDSNAHKHTSEGFESSDVSSAQTALSLRPQKASDAQPPAAGQEYENWLEQLSPAGRKLSEQALAVQNRYERSSATHTDTLDEDSEDDAEILRSIEEMDMEEELELVEEADQLQQGLDTARMLAKLRTRRQAK